MSTSNILERRLRTKVLNCADILNAVMDELGDNHKDVLSARWQSRETISGIESYATCFFGNTKKSINNIIKC